jgi:hypothetical protein
MENKYIAFYVDLPHKDFTQITNNIVEHYTIDKYLITAEKTQTGIEHYHFLIHCTQNTYAAIMQKLKSDYSLKGKAEKDGRRQYGKLKKIENIDRLKIYMLKDWKQWKLIKTNIDKDKIEQLHALSFKKNEKFARIEILKKNFQELIKKSLRKNEEIIDNLDYSSVIAQNQNYSLNLQRLLAKNALKIWTIKEDLRPPLMKTLLCYARPIIGDNTFMEHYYNL